MLRVVSLPLPHRRLLRESAVGLLLLLLLHLLVGMVMVPVGYVTVHVHRSCDRSCAPAAATRARR